MVEFSHIFHFLRILQTYFYNIMAPLVYISLIAKDDKYFLRLFLLLLILLLRILFRFMEHFSLGLLFYNSVALFPFHFLFFLFLLILYIFWIFSVSWRDGKDWFILYELPLYLRKYFIYCTENFSVYKVHL